MQQPSMRVCAGLPRLVLNGADTMRSDILFVVRVERTLNDLWLLNIQDSPRM